MLYTKRIIPVTPDDTNYLTRSSWLPDQLRIVRTPASSTVASNLLTMTAMFGVVRGNDTDNTPLVNGDRIMFDTLGTVTGISLGVIYYLVGVSGNNLQVATSFGGTAVTLGGTNVTPPTFHRTHTVNSGRVTGFLTVTASGNVALLPESHDDTNATAQADMGVQIVYMTQGTILPILVKKVFSTGTTATGIKLLTLEEQRVQS